MALDTCKYEIISINWSINRKLKGLKVLLLLHIQIDETWLNLPESLDARHQKEENYA